MQAFRYPCTGHVSHTGFGSFLERELGPPRANLHAFARELGQTFGAEHLTLVNSGSSANLASALALAERTGAGAHAITAGFTFSTTLAALKIAGFSVTVVDTLPDGFTIDPEAIRRSLRGQTRLLCVTHFLGFPADMQAIGALADEHRLFILQDACEAMDLRSGGMPTHRHGTLTTWSFYHPHHLPAYGGGAILCPDAEWRRQIESITHWGRGCTCHYDADLCSMPEDPSHAFTYLRPGLNLDLSELNACFGRWQLAQWAEIERRRMGHYAILYEALASCPSVRVYPCPRDNGSPSVFPLTLIRGEVPDLAERLARCGVEIRSLMGGTITDQPAYRHVPHDGLVHCRALSQASFFVGIHQTLPEEDVRQVAAILAEEVER
jgi:CDP-6-deoxy-D-xylo-4-hexulose-3-dehydrase